MPTKGITAAIVRFFTHVAGDRQVRKAYKPTQPSKSEHCGSSAKNSPHQAASKSCPSALPLLFHQKPMLRSSTEIPTTFSLNHLCACSGIRCGVIYTLYYVFLTTAVVHFCTHFSPPAYYSCTYIVPPRHTCLSERVSDVPTFQFSLVQRGSKLGVYMGTRNCF